MEDIREPRSEQRGYLRPPTPPTPQTWAPPPSLLECYITGRGFRSILEFKVLESEGSSGGCLLPGGVQMAKMSTVVILFSVLFLDRWPGGEPHPFPLMKGTVVSLWLWLLEECEPETHLEPQSGRGWPPLQALRGTGLPSPAHLTFPGSPLRRRAGEKEELSVALAGRLYQVRSSVGGQHTCTFSFSF